MDTKDLVILVVTAVIAISGWLVAHGFTVKREIEQKKREVRVRYLREAYLNIANLCDRGSFPNDIAQLQDALNDIQLFGDEAQVELVGKVVTSLTTENTADFNELLKQLRNEIRGHIGLNALSSSRWYIRSLKK